MGGGGGTEVVEEGGVVVTGVEIQLNLLRGDFNRCTAN